MHPIMLFNKTLIYQLLCLSLNFLIIASPQLYALEVNDRNSSYNLTKDTYWLEDKSQLMTISDILKPQALDRFQRNQKKSFNLGYKDSHIWLQLKLKRGPQQALNKNWFLSIDNPLLDHIDIYHYENQSLLKKTTLGDQYPFAKRLIKQRTFIYPIRFSDAPIELYIKVASSSALDIPLYLHDDINLTEQYSEKSTYYGIYFGIILFTLLYCLFNFISTRKPFVFYALMYIAAVGFMQATVNGYSFQYLWPALPALNQAIILTLFNLCCLFALLLSRHFLSFTQKSYGLEILFNGSIALAIILSLLSPFMDYQSANEAGLILIVISCLVIFFSTVNSINRGDKTSRLFLLSWLCIAPSIISYSLITAQYVNLGALTETAILAGSALQAILLALAINNRINEKLQRNYSNKAAEHSQLQQQFNELEQAAAYSKRESLLKDSFLATISHELRNPINGIEGALSLIDRKTLNKQQCHYINAANNSAQNLTTLINSIVHFSEIQAGTARAKKESFELRPTFNRLAESFRHRCNIKNIRFHWHIDKNVPNYIISDCDQLSLVLSQLVDNAIKYTDQGVVTVTLSTANQQLYFSVNDSGSGIHPSKLTAMQKELQRSDSEYLRHHHDLGIGLSICHRVCLLLNAQLHIESTVGQGSLFTFAISLQVPSIELQQDYNSDNNNKEKIVLIAEDNPVNQMVLKGMLEKLDCIVLSANNGQQALDILQLQPVDIILMDCQMPVMDGFAATQKIRLSSSAYSNIPIIAVTANAMAGDNEQCIAQGMNDYIKKPINRDLLAQKIHYWLRETN